MADFLNYKIIIVLSGRKVLHLLLNFLTKMVLFLQILIFVYPKYELISVLLDSKILFLILMLGILYYRH